MKFLIVGCGSMGKRRARCLRRLGYSDIAAYDVREDRLDDIAEAQEVLPFGKLDAALDSGIDFALICVPPHRHMEYLSLCSEAGIPAFCEAPMTLTLSDADRVMESAERAGVFLAPSCTYLHNAIHKRVGDILDSGDLGRPLAAVSHVGQHVADWHPYENYREFYASKRSEGGMCLDMLPHDFQLFMGYFGEVKTLSCMARRRAGGIESDTDACDVYDVLMDMEAGVSLAVHQDMFQRPWGNYRKIMCEGGAIEFNWRSLRVCCYGGPGFLKEPEWKDVTPEGYDFEAMYVEEVRHALAAYAGQEEYQMPPTKERRVLQIVLACEESSKAGRQITFQ